MNTKERSWMNTQQYFISQPKEVIRSGQINIDDYAAFYDASLGPNSNEDSDSIRKLLFKCSSIWADIDIVSEDVKQ